MTLGTVIIIVVAITASAVVRLARIRNGTDRWQRRGFVPHRQAETGLPSPREAELQREVEDLRTRIHVLERIATDGRHTSNLAAEIESLRGH